MSIQERLPQKPFSRMTPAEWEAHKRWVDEQRVARGEEPLDWRGVHQPLPTSPADLERIRQRRQPRA